MTRYIKALLFSVSYNLKWKVLKIQYQSIWYDFTELFLDCLCGLVFIPMLVIYFITLPFWMILSAFYTTIFKLKDVEDFMKNKDLYEED